MIVEVKDVSFSFPDKKVLDTVSFSVDRGDGLAVLGPNGVGKTTLIRLLTGVLQPENGSILIDGIGYSHAHSHNIKKMIGIMMPITGVYLKMTGYEYLSLIGAVYEMEDEQIKERINELAHQLSFENEIHREIKKYSSGTKKKVEFSAALISSPKILFLDEPFESIDPQVSYEMKSYIKEYLRNKGTLVITSHILDTIQNLCTKYVIIKDGKIIDNDNIQNNINLEEKYMKVITGE